MNLTPWFPSHIQPVRVGVYETIPDTTFISTGFFQYWDGTYWRMYAGDKGKAASRKWHQWSAYQNPRWRGIAK